MHYFTIILALAAAAWAIDVRAFLSNSHCQGRYGYKIGAQPDHCYYYDDRNKQSSWGFYAIPKDWRISTHSYGGPECNDLLMTRDSEGATWVCHGDKRPKWEYQGAGYNFINDKKAEAVAADDKRECHGPDGIVFEGGETYEFKNVDETTVQTM